MKMRWTARKEHSCSGMALVLVVGMLALMVTLAVAFSIFMRTEQLAAGSYARDATARELLQAGLARALAQIENDLGDSVYPSWDVLVSGGATNRPFNPLLGTISNWVPRGAFITTDPDKVSPGWIVLDSVDGYKGEVAYMVLNCSGLLDANYAGGGLPRAYGTSPDEIHCPEVTDTNALVANRDYAIQRELSKFGQMSPQLTVTHSAFPNVYAGGSDRGLIDISSLASITNNRASIIERFRAMTSPDGATSFSDPDFMYNALVDYVDENTTPNDTDLAKPCTENVPMVNEVWVAPSLNVLSSNCSVVLEVGAEWAYPFLGPTTDRFTYLYEVQVSAFGGTKEKYVPAGGSKAADSGYAGDANLYGVASVAPYTNSPCTWTNGDVVQLIVSVGVRVSNTTAIVDSVPFPYPGRFLTVTTELMTIRDSGYFVGATNGYECVDPRFNWDTATAGNWPNGQWFAYGTIGIPAYGSAGFSNTVAGRWIEEWHDPGNNTWLSDTNLDLYIAGGALHNVGELSYLLRGTQPEDRWNSIKIAMDQRTIPIDPVLDYFVLSDRPIRHGLLNLNAQSRAAWKAVFQDMPLDLYPGDSTAPLISDTEAQKLADAVTNFMANACTNVSEIGQVTNSQGQSFCDIIPDSVADHPFRKRAVVRNISSLIDWRQQYFLVVLYAMPRTNKREGTVPDVQAIAEVWRDPMKNNLEAHAKIIHSYSVLQNLTMP